MTRWVLKCEVCGEQRILDVGYNLREFKKLYLYCKSCGRNTPHKVLGIEQGEAASSPKT